MRVWVTRASPGAERTAARLRAMGHSPLISAVMRVKQLPAEIDLADVAAIAFTSANAVDAFASRSPERDLPVFAVGDATAQAAREAGFVRVASAAGDVEALGRTLAEAGLPAGAVVLHPGGRERAGDLPGAAGPGLRIRPVTLYETLARAPSEALAVLDHDGVDAVLVHSSKAARRIASVCRPWREGRAWFLCLSRAVAAPLVEAGYEKVRAAPFPDEAALLKLLSETPTEPAAMTDADDQDAPKPAPTDEPEAYTPPGPAARRPLPRGAWRLLALLGAGVLAAVLLAIYAPRMLSRPDPAAAGVVAVEPESAEALKARIAELERALAAAGTTPQRPAGPPLASADAGAINARLDRLEQAQRRSARAASAAVAAAALADAAATSRPFVAEVLTLERLMPGSEALAGLRPLAETGAPTRAALSAEFPDVATRAAAASRGPTPDAGVLARVGGALSALITLRRVDDLTGGSPDAILARAERRAADGDIEGALQQMRALPEGGQRATAAWRERAARRLEIERRIAALRTAALRDLATAQEEATL